MAQRYCLASPEHSVIMTAAYRARHVEGHDMKITSTDQMREIEKEADGRGLTYATMMENAGQAVALEIRDHFGARDKAVLVLVGPGNNGGDGLVAARHLHDEGANVRLYLWKRKVRGDDNFRQTQDRGIPYLRADDDKNRQQLNSFLDATDIVVDALLGTGVTRPIGGVLEDVLNLLKQKRNELRGDAPRVVAVDVPTGLDCDSGEVDPATVPADLTVTLALPKRGFYSFPGSDYLGELVISDIGIPPAMTEHLSVELLEPELVKSKLPDRPRRAHKGTFGKALIVAGSPNYTGAAYLASAAATRVGAGLVTLSLAQSLHPILASKLTEVTFLLLPHDLGALVPQAIKLLQERLPEYDALLVGPGLGLEDSSVEFVHEFVCVEPSAVARKLGFVPATGQPSREAEEKGLPPLVIDADGLNALARASRWWESLASQAVLTPHPGEMSRLLDCSLEEVESDRVAIAQKAAQKWTQVVVLKGAHTVIAAPDDRVVISPFANPGLASAGTGDVLAGSIVGFLAQGLSPYEAAVAGVYVHGAAGEMATAAMGNAGTVAGDLLPLLPLVLKKLRTD